MRVKQCSLSFGILIRANRRYVNPVSEPQIILIAGPTASGKSALALEFARRLGGTIINSDAMQCYRELRIVTARPTEADEARVPHRLYGVRPAAEAGHVRWWREAALAAMAETEGLPILCGGTGLYFSALTDGIADIPERPAEGSSPAGRIRQEPASVHTPTGHQGDQRHRHLPLAHDMEGED